MASKDNLKNFSLEQLREIREKVLSVESKEELLEIIEKVISTKEKEEEIASTSMNARFPIDWMNIDPPYKTLLHKNGIETLAQLRDVKELWSLEGMTPNGEIQLMWAREFFNMDSLEKGKNKGRQPVKSKRNTK